MSEKIKPEHQQRLAIVYIRQSSPGQVKNHRESYRVQKRLTNRAITLGWPAERVKVIEGDQGVSASQPLTRDDFRMMVQMVQDQQVGIVFGIDVARLARNSIDWSVLTHWCALHGSLLGDQNQVYDPSLPQDSLVLGIQGVLAVHELHSIRNRLQAALTEKASRGELHFGVPRGYVVVEGKHLRKHPDRRVQKAITQVFDKFTTCTSVGQLLTRLWEQKHLIPRSRVDGTQVEWVEPDYNRLLDMLRNPKYAGIYVYPRHRQETKVLPCGKLQKTSRRTSPDEWEVILKDHHPGYITPQQYQANQQKIDMNAQRYAPSSGAPNKGKSLLAGLIECRRCGHKMQVRYSSSGQARYCCRQGRRQRERDSKGCLRFAAEELERQLSEHILYTVSPAGVSAAKLAADRMSSHRDARRANLSDQLEQYRYEADLARRRFDQVDPANRLVFDTLAKELEVALQSVAQQESKLQQFDREEPPRPSREERQRLEDLGSRLEEVWHARHADGRLKQQIVRLLIEHVTADLDEARDEVVLWIKWSGGHHTELRSSRRRVGSGRSRVDLDSIIGTLRKIADDESISRSLNRVGVLSVGDKTWTKKRVSQYRHRSAIAGFDATLKEKEGWLTQQETATYLGISPMSVNRLIQQGILSAEGEKRLPQVIRRADLVSEEVKAMVHHIKSHGNAPLPKNPKQKSLFFSDLRKGVS
jgi:DNA invertase Pin-like site-specific DNA recombinase